MKKMAASWLLQAIYTSVLSQSALIPIKPSTDPKSSFVTIHTSYGDLKGVRKVTDTNVLVDSYLGIPFALPPVDQHRFSKPEPPAKWNGVRDATQFRNECHQRPLPGNELIVGDKPVDQSEDCLYLNVYVPGGSQTGQPLAVMVWIHGGGYILGAGSQYDGSELAATGVIVVTINYRLDVFGFLSNEDVEIPGNFAMLDQVMALKWVKENIQSFGGDPNQVTIFGESAGSSSVSLLVLSPMASGLFNRAIMESGASLASWAVSAPAARITPRTTLALIGIGVGCTDFDITKKLQCFRNVDAVTLLNASISVQSVYPLSLLHAPRVDHSFLPDLPTNLLTKNMFNHVDTIHGFNTDEAGQSIINFLVDEQDDGLSKDEVAKYMKEFLALYAIANADQIINEIIKGYVGNVTDKKFIRSAAVKAMSDLEFKVPTILEANIQSGLAKGNNHYVYEFQYKSSFSSMPSWLKAVHGEELAFVFGVNLREFRRRMSGKIPTKDDNIVWNQVKSLWSNFAKYGNPTQTVPNGAVNWTPYNAKDAKYLKIDTTSQILSYNNTQAIYLNRKLLKQLQVYNVDAVVG